MTNWIKSHPILTAFTTLQVIDFATTHLGITALGAVEQNRFVAMIIGAYGLLGALILLKGLGVLFGLHLGEKNRNLRRAVWIYSLAMTWNCGVVVYHLSTKLWA